MSLSTSDTSTRTVHVPGARHTKVVASKISVNVVPAVTLTFAVAMSVLMSCSPAGAVVADVTADSGPPPAHAIGLEMSVVHASTAATQQLVTTKRDGITVSSSSER